MFHASGSWKRRRTLVGGVCGADGIATLVSGSMGSTGYHGRLPILAVANASKNCG
ncbi:MAG: hypothetical protein ACK6DC_08785 [Planctomycetota bacterium]